MSLTAEKRAQIVRAAKEWLCTPYHHRACVKGVGADCAMFPLAIYKQCGLIPPEYQPPEYAMQWHLNRSEELYLKELEKFCSEFIGPPQPGDFVVFRFGRTFSHGAIVVRWPLIVHSCIPHGVVLGDALRDGELAGRERKVFEIAPGSQNRHASEPGPIGEAEHAPSRASWSRSKFGLGYSLKAVWREKTWE